MSDDRLKLELEPCLDRFNNKYYIAKLKGPFTIDCKNGVSFLVFTANPGEEELQIAHITNPKDRS